MLSTEKLKEPDQNEANPKRKEKKKRKKIAVAILFD